MPDEPQNSANAEPQTTGEKPKPLIGSGGVDASSAATGGGEKDKPERAEDAEDAGSSQPVGTPEAERRVKDRR